MVPSDYRLRNVGLRRLHLLFSRGSCFPLTRPHPGRDDMKAREALELLLRKLKERTNYCPYCGGEYVHRTESCGATSLDCPLKGRWFYEETKEKE